MVVASWTGFTLLKMDLELPQIEVRHWGSSKLCVLLAWVCISVLPRVLESVKCLCLYKFWYWIKAIKTLKVEYLRTPLWAAGLESLCCLGSIMGPSSNCSILWRLVPVWRVQPEPVRVQHSMWSNLRLILILVL